MEICIYVKFGYYDYRKCVINFDYQLQSILILSISLTRPQKMSFNEDRLKMLEEKQQHQESFFKGFDQDANLPPTQLSGDQNAQQSVFSQIESKNKANFLLTVTTIIKTVIGSGILGLPYVVSKCGYVFAILVFLFATAITQFGSVLLLKAKNLTGHSNFSTILYHIYHNKISKGLGSILIFLNNIGICIAQIIIFKASIHKIIKDSLGADSQILNNFYTSEWFIVLCIAALEIPFVIVKKIQSLKFMALSGVVGILIFIAVFLVNYFITLGDYVQGPSHRPMELFPSDWFAAVASIPNLILALSYQMNFFPVYKGMRDASDKKMALAALVGTLICSASYLIVGIFGYHLAYTLTDATEVKTNFLQTLDYKSTEGYIFYLINSTFLVSVFFAFPIMFFGCRNNFIALLQLFLTPNDEKLSKKWRQNSDNLEMISSYIQSEDKFQKKKRANRLFYIYTAGIYAIIVSVGIVVDDIEAVFNIVGAVCSTSIGILLPCFFYFMLIIKKNKKRTFKFYISLLVFGIMAPFAVFSVIAKYIE